MSNPFRSANIRPGANQFIFAQSESLGQLVQRLDEQIACEIRGSHGTGKSTLMTCIADECERQGWLVHRDVLDACHDSKVNPMHTAPLSARHHDPIVLWTIDGFEQLAGSKRRKIVDYSRSRSIKLLVTTHRSAGLALLYATRSEPSIVRQLVDRILSREQAAFIIEDRQIETALARHHGNIREALFDLYDLFADASS